MAERRVCIRTYTHADHGAVLPLWQRGFLEMGPYLHQDIQRSPWLHAFALTFIGAALLRRHAWVAGVLTATYALILSPVGAWLLQRALWQGILAQTRADMTPERLPQVWQSPKASEFFVATLDERVLGCVAVRMLHTLHKERRAGVPEMEGQASVWRLSVDHTARRCGAGRELMAAAEAWARGNGAERVSLVTGNPDSVKFYQRLGYTPETFPIACRAVFGCAPDRVPLSGYARRMGLWQRTSGSKPTVWAKQL